MGQAEGWLSHQQRSGLIPTGFGRIAAALGTAAAVVLAAVLTLIFAATLLVGVVLTAALISVYAATHRRRQPQGVLIEARRVGHSWVAYGWDQRPR